MLSWGNCMTHYYSIDDILSSQEKVPCTFLKSVPQADAFGPRSDTGGIEKNTVVEIPLWLAEELADEEYGVVKVEVPRIYKDVYRDILNADASVVDLYKMSNFFYYFGKHISAVSSDHSTELNSLLIHTFKERFRQLLDWVQNMSAEEIVTDKLDFLERQLLLNSRSAQNKLQGWLSHGIDSIQPAEAVLNHKKRKLAALEAI